MINLLIDYLILSEALNEEKPQPKKRKFKMLNDEYSTLAEMYKDAFEKLTMVVESDNSDTIKQRLCKQINSEVNRHLDIEAEKVAEWIKEHYEIRG